MKVHLLQGIIDQFVGQQLRNKQEAWYYPHAMVGHFHATWSPPVPSTLATMYDDALRSEYSQRWWKREAFRPKELMLQLMQTDADLASIAWKDLSNDQASLEGRISRFLYYCNDLLQIYRQKHPLSVDTYHHQDASVISLYLAGLFPDKYALYPGLGSFTTFCEAVGSPDIPVVDDLVRYQKVATIVYTFLQKHPQMTTLLAQRSEPYHKVRCIPFQISYEVISAGYQP